MARRLTLLLITTLALTCSGSALADGNAADSVAAPELSGISGELQPTSTPGEFSVLAGSSVTCSTAWPSATVGCWWERPVLVLGDLELAVGVDAQAVLTGSWEDAHLAPYVIVAYYGPQLGAWAEVRLPELSGVPVLGSPDWLRIGVSYRWGP